MGKKENPLLVYYNQPERFAQLLNGWLFQGRSFLEAGDVKEADRRMEEKGGRRKEYAAEAGICSKGWTMRLYGCMWEQSLWNT